jgi:putative Ca2+/H+ antiporter (TMEM165/GDT1 family)
VGLVPLRLFITSWITVFLSEMGDKTQITTLLLAMSRAQWVWFVFLGSASALCTAALLETSLGWWVAKRVRPASIKLASGLAFAVMGVLLVFGIIGSGGH